MRVLVVHCHPVETSFHAALHGDVVRRLRRAGHEVDDCDIHAEGVDPVASRAERRRRFRERVGRALARFA